MQLAKFEDMGGKPVKKFTFFSKRAWGLTGCQKLNVFKLLKWNGNKQQWKLKKLGVIIPFSKEFLRYSVQDFMQMAAPLIC